MTRTKVDTSPQRYEMRHGPFGDQPYMNEADNGDYVSWEDYEHLLKVMHNKNHNVAAFHVISNGKRSEDACGELADHIKALIYEYSGIIPLAAAIGVLSIVQQEILEHSK